MVWRLLLVDDSPELLRQLTLWLADFSDFEIAATVTSGFQALRMMGVLKPDLVLLDMNMPRLNGLETLQQLRSRWPDTKALILTSHADDAWAVPALRAGAVGYILKTVTSSELAAAIRYALSGGMPVHQQVIESLVSAHPLNAPAETVHLSPCELEVLKSLACGKTNVEIGDALYLSLSMVKKTLASLSNKLGASNRTHIVSEATRRGLLSRPESIRRPQPSTSSGRSASPSPR